jgi:hypothetical protein
VGKIPARSFLGRVAEARRLQLKTKPGVDASGQFQAKELKTMQNKIPESPGKSSKKTVIRTIVASLSDDLVKNLFERDGLREPFRTALEGEWDRRFFKASGCDEDINPEAFLESFNVTMTTLIKEAECNGKSPEPLMTFKLTSNRKFHDAA